MKSRRTDTKASAAQSSRLSLVFPKSTPTVLITTSLARDDAYGSFTPTTPAFPSLRGFVDCNPPPPSYLVSGPYTRQRHHSMYEWGQSDLDDAPSESSSIPGSPTSSYDYPPPPSVPSITRTSSYGDSPVASSSLALLNGCMGSPSQAQNTKINPILFALERNSRLCTRGSSCATCGKTGSDYPRCGKCGEMWCSRPCRIRNGKKHVCARTLI